MCTYLGIQTSGAAFPYSARKAVVLVKGPRVRGGWCSGANMAIARSRQVTDYGCSHDGERGVGYNSCVLGYHCRLPPGNRLSNCRLKPSQAAGARTKKP